MNKKIAFLLLTVSLPFSAIQCCAAESVEQQSDIIYLSPADVVNTEQMDYGITFNNDDVLGDPDQLSAEISDTLNQMGVQNVTSYQLLYDADSQFQSVLVNADNVMICISCNYVNESWNCATVYNPTDSGEYYWVSSDDQYVYEIIDYKSGNYIMTDSAQSVLDQYVDINNWFSIYDFAFYDSDGSELFSYKIGEEYSIIASDIESELEMPAFSYHGGSIGDDFSDFLANYNLDSATILVYGAQADSDSQQTINDAMAEMYMNELDGLSADDKLNILSSISTDGVIIYIEWDLAVFYGCIIEEPDLFEDKIFCDDKCIYAIIAQDGVIIDFGFGSNS